jgi:RimJ/RimL family protein N-acetyltransferase
MQIDYRTPRLLLTKLTMHDAEFIMELVNTPGWLKFIGNRSIGNTQQAAEYIRKIIADPDINYWVVKTKDENTPVGIISFIRRQYLDHHDIGFAFLPAHTGRGYAYEATAAVLNDIINDGTHTQVLATTVKENTNSIKLLLKLGFACNREIERENEILLVYCIATDKAVPPIPSAVSLSKNKSDQ